MRKAKLDGRPISQEEWDAYEEKLAEHQVRMLYKRDFAKRILDHAERYGVQSARAFFKAELDMEDSCDAPNEPGYYRANND